MPPLLRGLSPEPHLPLVPSQIVNGLRMRVAWNRYHWRPMTETFHEFLAAVVGLSFGEEWWRQQESCRSDDQHVVVRWTMRIEFVRSRTATAERVGVPLAADAPPPVWALTQLGYDLFCLQAKDRLPEFLVKRLRKRDSFQSARYEIAAAAVMARSGFEIEFLDTQERVRKHCEFLATHRASGVAVGVEAKSRVRCGALHERGTFAYTEDSEGLRLLVRKALKQRPSGIPFIVFVDVNVPATAGVKLVEKPWVRDLLTAIGKMSGAAAVPPRKDRFSLLIATKLGFHFGSINDVAIGGERIIVEPQNPEYPLDFPALRNALRDTLDRYDRIPPQM